MHHARTPNPPYVAVLFTSQRSDLDAEGYDRTAMRMEDLASSYPGFLGIESARGTDGMGISISYWKDVTAAECWKANFEHQTAQRLGRDRWYESYSVRIAVVEREYGFTRARD